MGELMSIGVFARRTGLSVSALRFYAGQGLLIPAEVDRASGYRRYAEAQVADGVLICDLRRLEMPLSDIALALQRTAPERKQLVERHLERLEQVVARAHALARTMGITDTTQESPMTTTLHALDLARALDQVLPAAGTDPELPDLMSVLIEGKDGSIRLVATDRYRLAIRDLVPSSLDGDFTAVVPAATLSQWRGSLDEASDVAMTLDERQLRLVGSGQELRARVVPVEFPDYERFLVPADDVTSVRVDRGRLLAALEASDPDRTVVLATADAALRLTDDDRVAEMGATCNGPHQEVAINARFAIDAVRHAVGAEVVIEIEDPVSTVLFRSADDGTFTSLVMPVKLD